MILEKNTHDLVKSIKSFFIVFPALLVNIIDLDSLYTTIFESGGWVGAPVLKPTVVQYSVLIFQASDTISFIKSITVA